MNLLVGVALRVFLIVVCGYIGTELVNESSWMHNITGLSVFAMGGALAYDTYKFVQKERNKA